MNYLRSEGAFGLSSIAALFGALLLLLISCPVNAQGPALCKELLKGGVFESFDSSTQSYNIYAFMNWVRDHRAASSQAGTGVSVAIPGLPSVGFDSTTYQQMETDYSKLLLGGAAAQTTLETHARTVSAALLQAFNECMRADGLHVWIATSTDPHEFYLQARFRASGSARNAKITGVDIRPRNIDCGRELRRSTTVEASTITMLCTRKTSEAVNIAINATENPDNGALQLPPIFQFMHIDPDIQGDDAHALGMVPSSSQILRISGLDRDFVPSCRQIKNFRDNQQYWNLYCNVRWQDNHWEVVVETTKHMNGEYWFEVNAPGLNPRTGKVWVPRVPPPH